MAKKRAVTRKSVRQDFRGVIYEVKWRHPRGYPASVGGSCSNPRARRPTIELSPRLKDFNKLRVMLDESIHACFFDLGNEEVDGASTSIARFLWENGLRFTQ